MAINNALPLKATRSLVIANLISFLGPRNINDWSGPLTTIKLSRAAKMAI